MQISPLRGSIITPPPHQADHVVCSDFLPDLGNDLPQDILSFTLVALLLKIQNYSLAVRTTDIPTLRHILKKKIWLVLPKTVKIIKIRNV